MKINSLITRILVGVLGGLAVLFMLIGGGMRLGHSLYTRNFVPVDGVITDFTRSGYPTLTYSIHGRSYTYTPHSRNSLQRVGDTVALLVNPDHETDVTDDTLPLIGLVLMLVGVSMGVPAVIILAVDRRRKQQYDALLTYGVRANVTVKEVRINTMVKVNLRHPVQLYATCRHPGTGNTIEIHSHNLMRTSVQPGDEVSVLFDTMDEKRYFFDVQEGA